MRKATAEAMASREKYSSTVIMPDIFKTVKDNVSILEAIERYGLNPIKRGSQYWVVCPFHADQNPSMAIYGNTYHCYGCQAHGDVIDFTARYFGLTLKEAIKKLANDFNVPLFGNVVSRRQKRKIQQQIRQKQEEDKLYTEFLNKYNETYNYLCELNLLYTEIKQAIETPEDMDIPEFVEACHNQDLVEYWIDILLEGDIEEQVKVMQEVEEWKAKQR